MAAEFGELFLELALILIAAELSGEFFKELGQTALLGQLSNLDEILKNAKKTSAVALTGIVAPFLLGYVTATLFGFGNFVGLFIGAALTASSLGITANVLEELGKINTKEARIILGATVFDDTVALLFLSFFSGGAVSGFSMIKNGVTAIVLLGVTIYIGLRAADFILHLVEMMHVRGSEIVISFAFVLLMAFFSDLIGLAPIIGAFAAGLIISKTHHRTEILKGIDSTANIFIPIFFVLVGTSVNLRDLWESDLFLFTIVLILAAVLGKIACGFAVSSDIRREIISAGMVPRGEIALIFAGVGLAQGIIGAGVFSSIVLLVVTTTLITPPFLKRLFTP
jgi:Kef-type K+ transport system membrane component KefB